MNRHSQRGKEPLRPSTQRDAAPPLPEHELAHRTSSISDVTDIGISPYEASIVSADTLASPLHAVASPSSLYSSGGGSNSTVHSPFGDEASLPRRPSWRGPLSYAGSRRYAPLAGDNERPSQAAPGRRSSAASVRSRSSYAPTLNTAIPENDEDESYAMTLLAHPAPMGMTPVAAQHTRHASNDATVPMSPIFDVGSALGPLSTHENEYISQWQQQEAQGVLSGGLGQGFRADSTLRDAELLASAPPPGRGRSVMARSFTFRRAASKRPTRAETIKTRGQDEANRLGRVIEVLIDDNEDNAVAAAEPSADLSTMEGSNISVHEPDELQRSTFPTTAPRRQIFFPRPNWKPWSMRWPHLTMLVLVSVGLAVMQEVLFRRFRNTPILTFHSPKEVKPLIYFAVKFLPTLAAVVYGVLWQFTDFEVRRLEAFYQLSKDGGALAAESINVDYVTSFNFFRPFRALKVGHYTVAVSSLGTLLAGSLAPTFAAATVILTPSLHERKAHPDAEKTLTFSSTWSRLLTSTLAVCAVLASILFILLQRRRSGLNSDVRGIAGLASMAVVSHILMDFKDMDTAKHHDIHHKLKYHRYMLRNSSLAPDDENPASSKDRQKYDDDVGHMSDNPHPLMLRPAGCVTFIAALVAFLGFVPAFVFTDAGVVTDKAPWFATAWAVCLKMSWHGMETAVRMMEPYYILWKRHAPAKTLTLDYTALPFGYLPLRALANGHLIMFFVGFGSILAEFLTVLVTGLTTSDGQGFVKAYGWDGSGGDKTDPEDVKSIYAGQDTLVSFSVSFGFAMFVLVYMTIVASVVFARRRHPFLPRQPSTIASVLAFIHQSKMLYNFVGTATLRSADMARRLAAARVPVTYGLGWFEGRDGQTHCGVDQEELVSGYKHGVDYTMGIKPWNMQWDEL